MERNNIQESKKAKINRIVSYMVIIISIIMLAFCANEIVRYISNVNKNAMLTSDLETLKQDSNYLKEHFDVLQKDEYYSVYIDGDYQYVDSQDDSVKIIK